MNDFVHSFIHSLKMSRKTYHSYLPPLDINADELTGLTPNQRNRVLLDRYFEAITLERDEHRKEIAKIKAANLKLMKRIKDLEKELEDKKQENIVNKKNLEIVESNLLHQKELVEVLEKNNNILVEEKKSLHEIIDKQHDDLEKEKRKTEQLAKDLELKILEKAHNDNLINILENDNEVLKQNKAKQEEIYERALNEKDAEIIMLEEKLEKTILEKEDEKMKKIYGVLSDLVGSVQDMQETTSLMNEKVANISPPGSVLSFGDKEEDLRSYATHATTTTSEKTSPRSFSKLNTETTGTVDLFLRDHVKRDPSGFVPAADLYQEYKNYSLALEEKPLTQRAFGGILTQRGFTKKKGNKGIIYTGIKLEK